MSDENTPVPSHLVQAVEEFVDREFDNAVKYKNKKVLDEEGVWLLHRLVAKAYAEGFVDGGQVEAQRAQHTRRRERELHRAEIAELATAAPLASALASAPEAPDAF